MRSLKFGANFVAHTKMSRDDARQKLNQELLMYLKRYRSVIEKESEIPECEVMRWLEVAIDTSEKDDVHQEFYSATLRSLAIGLGIGKRVNDGIKVDYKHFVKEGICVEEADKNVGGQTCKFKTAEEVRRTYSRKFSSLKIQWIKILADSSTNIMEIECDSFNS